MGYTHQLSIFIGKLMAIHCMWGFLFSDKPTYAFKAEERLDLTAYFCPKPAHDVHFFVINATLQLGGFEPLTVSSNKWWFLQVLFLPFAMDSAKCCMDAAVTHPLNKEE